MNAGDLLFAAGGAYLGSKLGNKYLGNMCERPVLTTHANNDRRLPALSVTAQRWRGAVWYRLYVADQEQWVMVAITAVYEQMAALIDQWEHYLGDGGTLSAWRATSLTTQQQAAAK